MIKIIGKKLILAGYKNPRVEYCSECATELYIWLGANRYSTNKSHGCFLISSTKIQILTPNEAAYRILGHLSQSQLIDIFKLINLNPEQHPEFSLIKVIKIRNGHK